MSLSERETYSSPVSAIDPMLSLDEPPPRTLVRRVGLLGTEGARPREAFRVEGLGLEALRNYQSNAA